MPIIEVSKLAKDFNAGRAVLRALADVSFSANTRRKAPLSRKRSCRARQNTE